MPGRVTDELSRGCNRLIWQGASPALSPAALLEELQKLLRIPESGRHVRKRKRWPDRKAGGTGGGIGPDRSGKKFLRRGMPSRTAVLASAGLFSRDPRSVIHEELRAAGVSCSLTQLMQLLVELALEGSCVQEGNRFRAGMPQTARRSVTGKGMPFIPVRFVWKDSVNYGGIPYFFIKFLATAPNMVYSDSRLLVLRLLLRTEAIRSILDKAGTNPQVRVGIKCRLRRQIKRGWHEPAVRAEECLAAFFFGIKCRLRRQIKRGSYGKISCNSGITCKSENDQEIPRAEL